MTTQPAKAAALLALALTGAAIGAGCGGGEEPQRASGPAATGGGEQARGGGAPGEGGQSGSITQRSEGGSGSDSSTSITQRSSSGSSSTSSSQSSSGGASGVSTFSGSGGTTLSFNVERPSRLSWTNSEGRPFSARGGGVSISSRRGRGEVELRPGRYDDVEVRGSSWTIVVRPR